MLLSPSLPRNLALGTFGKLLNSVLNKGKSAIIPPLFNGPEVLSSDLIKQNYLLKNLSKNSNLDDSGISLPVLPLELI